QVVLERLMPALGSGQVQQLFQHVPPEPFVVLLEALANLPRDLALDRLQLALGDLDGLFEDADALGQSFDLVRRIVVRRAGPTHARLFFYLRKIGVRAESTRPPYRRSGALTFPRVLIRSAIAGRIALFPERQ